MVDNRSDIKNGIVAIVTEGGVIAGSGFVVGNDVVITCSHVIYNLESQQEGVRKASISNALGDVYVQFVDGSIRAAKINRMSEPDEYNVCVLNVSTDGVERFVVGSSSDVYGHDFLTYGFLENTQTGMYIEGRIAGSVNIRLPNAPERRGIVKASRAEPPKELQERLQLQLQSFSGDSNLSGAPVFDNIKSQVVGMISESNRGNIFFAIPSEILKNNVEDLLFVREGSTYDTIYSTKPKQFPTTTKSPDIGVSERTKGKKPKSDDKKTQATGKKRNTKKAPTVGAVTEGQNITPDLPNEIIKPIRLEDSAIDKYAATDKPIQNVKQDKLDFKIYVNALHSFILSKYTTTPITISIDGPWGTGKSSLMSMLKGKLDPQRDGIRKLYEWSAGLHPWRRWYFSFLKSSIAKWFGDTVITLLVRNDVDEEGIYLYFGQNNKRFHKYISDIVEGFSIDPEALNQPDNEKMEERIRKWAMVHANCEPMQPPYHYAVWLNAWKFDNQEEVWASLALATMEQIKQKHGLLWRLWFWLDLTFRRFSFWSALWQVVKQFLVPLIFAIIAAYYNTILGSFDTPLQAFVNYGTPLLWAGFVISGILAVSSIFKDPFRISLEKVFDRPNYKDKVSFLAHFERDFAKIVRSATKNGFGWKPSKLVIFIDDLDRCEPPKSADIVEAVNLFLDAEGCVFVIGMDSDSVSKSVEVKYKDLFERMKAENTGVVSLGRSFLDKIVQIPFSVPRATPQQIASMVNDALGAKVLSLSANVPFSGISASSSAGSSGAPIVGSDSGQTVGTHTTEQIENIPPIAQSRIDPASYARPEVRAAILKGTELLADNPRQVKTFINLFRLSIYIAHERKIFEERIVGDKKSGLNLDKLAVWTACSVRWPEIIHHLSDETQRPSLRGFLAKSSQALSNEYRWREEDYTKLKTNLKDSKEREKERGGHWCHLPWEWWFIEPDFVKTIKLLEDFWPGLEKDKIVDVLWDLSTYNEKDWLRDLLTMTRPISQ
jgi:hypothetical protein